MKNFRITMLTLFLVSSFVQAQNTNAVGSAGASNTNTNSAGANANPTTYGNEQTTTGAATNTTNGYGVNGYGTNYGTTSTTGTGAAGYGIYGTGTTSVNGMNTMPGTSVEPPSGVWNNTYPATATPAPAADTTGTLGNGTARTECPAGDTTCTESRTSR